FQGGGEAHAAADPGRGRGRGAFRHRHHRQCRVHGHALRQAGGSRGPQAQRVPGRAVVTEPNLTEPNLLAAVAARARQTGAARGVRFLRFGDADISLSYPDLLGMAGWLGRQLPATNGYPMTVVVAANSPMPALLAFFAALGVGARPLILPGPTALGGGDAFVRRVRQALALFPGRCVLALEDGLLPGAAPVA